MLRFYYLAIVLFPVLVYYIVKMTHYANHPEKYDEQTCFDLVMKLIGRIKKTSKITTDVYGTDSLPEEGGYVMYANHQGRYDAIGIMSSHPTPCTVVMDKRRARMPLSNEFIKCLKGKRLDKTDLRQQVKIMQEITEEVKEGRLYLIFPEGGYTDNHNTLQTFLSGSFKCAQKAKCPIVPVAIWDSYKPYEINSLKPVKTQVHFLDAIGYEEYAGKSTAEIRDMVKEKIQEKMDEIAGKEECFV